MSDSNSSNKSGFRSRQRQLEQRRAMRKSIIQEFQAKKKQSLQQNYIQAINPVISNNSSSTPSQFLTISEQSKLYALPQQQFDNQSDQQSIDMFEQEEKPVDIEASKRIASKTQERTDDQGYFIVIEGQIIGSQTGHQYRVIQKLGKGMFGSVLKAMLVKNQGQIKKQELCKDQEKAGQIFAIKVIRRNEMMQQSGQREYEILSGLKKKPQPQYIMKLFDYFFEAGHLCLVCELMGEDLRSYARKHQDKITLENIREYAISMFMSLYQLRKNKIIHADIKPDNFLFSAEIDNTQNQSQKKLDGLSLTVSPLTRNIKLCDFGTAYRVEQHSLTDELVARYYRAPEIMLGYETSVQNRHHIDTWAVACSLYELYTGEFLFNGTSNNEMLKKIMETKGKFNLKMQKNSVFAQNHFDSQGNFLFEVGYDQVKKCANIKKMQVTVSPQMELLSRLKKYKKSGQDGKKLHNFKDFLEKCLSLNPKDRLTPAQAFMHPFLNFQVKLS